METINYSASGNMLKVIELPLNDLFFHYKELTDINFQRQSCKIVRFKNEIFPYKILSHRGNEIATVVPFPSLLTIRISPW